MKIKMSIFCLILIIMSNFIMALPHHYIYLNNKSSNKVKFVVVDNHDPQNEAYSDASGNTTYEIKPGETKLWPPENSLTWFDDILYKNVDIRIWSKTIWKTISSINMNGGCNIEIIDNPDRRKLNQIKIVRSPYCRNSMSDDFPN